VSNGAAFVHESEDWDALLLIVADAVQRDVGLVEKDYWVTHALWAIHHQGFEVWFKGGTSLSKGFGLIERFSEDIDVRIDSGTTGLTDPKLSWNNKKGGVEERRGWFDAVAKSMSVPACTIVRDPAGSDDLVRSAWFEVRYPPLHAEGLPPDMRPFVLLEVGRARVVPFVPRDLSSWVHDHLEAEGQLADYIDNRPRGVRCIHPRATCLEKLEAIARKFEQDKPAPEFVRHYEDAARIIAAGASLPPLKEGLGALLAERAAKDHKVMPPSNHASFDATADTERWRELQKAWERIGPMYWGERIPLLDACATIRKFIDELGLV
jgi:Nucleotidyl transferase AbiEii toxin, Type IV TA system